MKFGRLLDAEAVPEWRPKYLNYRRLKDLLRHIPMHENVPEGTNAATLSSSTDLEAAFFEAARVEFDKIQTFFWERLEAAVLHYQELEAQLEHFRLLRRMPPPKASDTDAPYGKNTSPASIRHRLKKAAIVFYGELELLEAFRSLNRQAFEKIMKKCDKVTGSHKGGQFLRTIRAEPLWSNRRIDTLTESLVARFTAMFAGADRHQAMQKLRSKDLAHATFHSEALVAGVTWTAAAACAVASLAIFLLDRGNGSEGSWRWMLAVIYAAQSQPLFLLLNWAGNVAAYNRVHINYRFIFQFDRRSMLHECQLFALVGVIALIFSATAMLTLLFAPLHSRTAPWIPLTATLSVFAGMPFLYSVSRVWFGRGLLRIATAPVFPVAFRDFFIADQMLSLTLAFQALGWAAALSFDPYRFEARPAALFANRLSPVLASVPFWWRGMQCIRRFRDTKMRTNLINAWKYSLSWIAFLLRSALAARQAQLSIDVLFGLAAGVSFIWDLVMDFGLVQFGARDRQLKGHSRRGGCWPQLLLRSELIYPRPVYSVLVLIDGIGRCLWIAPFFFRTFRPNDWHSLLYLSFAIAGFELLRRCAWNALRLEFEHLNNCNMFKATADLALPFETSDLFYANMVEVGGSKRSDPASLADLDDDDHDQDHDQDEEEFPELDETEDKLEDGIV